MTPYGSEIYTLLIVFPLEIDGVCNDYYYSFY